MDLHHLVGPIVAVMLIVASTSQADGDGIFRKPPPEGVVEITGISAGGGIVELEDGSLMLAQGSSYRLSSDGGRTWGEAQPLNEQLGTSGLIRLHSGTLAIYGSKGGNWCFSSSPDEGKTWTEPAVICPTSAASPMYHSMIQLTSGRLLLTGYWEGLDSWEYTGGTMVSVHPELQYLDVAAHGLWRGQRILVEGHAHAPEMAMCIVYRSDDEGQTWQKHPGALMGWFDFEGNVNGYCGNIGCFEPTIAETKDGNVLLIMRATVGRQVQSFSPDGGEQWYAVVPSELPSSESPALMVALPATGDLLIVWNQMSREEIRRGYRRGRLSAAISKDGGHSWENFKTLELSEGLQDIDRIPPEYPIQMVRARDWVGPLPAAWAYCPLANMAVAAGNVFIRYSRGTPLLGVAEQNLHKQESVMRIYPLDWFYE